MSWGLPQPLLGGKIRDHRLVTAAMIVQGTLGAMDLLLVARRYRQEAAAMT
jgi:hypothetical protein|nr:hypothetical protein [uncultured Tistrella sp.]